jgi:hypothetical protein
MKRSTTIASAGLAVLGLLAAGCGDDDSTSTATPAGQGDGTSETTAAVTPVIDPGDGGRYDPNIDPADFVPTIDNPYMPLTPGARWEYDGSADGEAERTVVVVTDQRRDVAGISATVVRDTVTVAGEVKEDTYDWYAQDRDGNVWYLGEETKEYENGEVSSTEGSWETDVDGALPGIVMPAHPTRGQAYRQEFYPGEAEDLAEITELDATKSIAMGDYDHVLVVKEWNPLDPDVVEQKYYAPGIGMIAEDTVTGGDDASELVELSSP